MPDPSFIAYLKTLKPSDWSVMATSHWTVKDVVAHMVAWEKGDVETIRTCWENNEQPWWKLKNEDDAFNARAVEYYKDFSPAELIAEWSTWQAAVRAEIDRIGEANLRSRPETFTWLFEGVGDHRADGKASHYKHHYDQIRKALQANAAV